MRALRLAVGVVLTLLAVPAAGRAAVLQPVDTFAGSILEVAFPPGDQRLFVVGQAGTIRIFKNGTTLGTPFLDLTSLVASGGERGLVSMAFDPNYGSNGLFYVDYTGTAAAGGAVGDLHLDEFKVSGNADVASLASRRPVLTIPHSTFANHNGGDLHFKGGDLYMSTGDGGGGGDSLHQGQDTSTLLGKLLRIDPHQGTTTPYTVPADNPFVGVAGADEVWSYGLRNPFRWSFDSADGALLIGDVGQGAREEIDYEPPGTGAGFGDNFGWNCREGLIAYTSPDAICASEPYPASFTDPVFDYGHSDPGGGAAFGCAIIGGFVYHGSQLPGLGGRYLYSDSCNGTLRSINLAGPSTSDRSEGVAVSSPSSIVECQGEPYVTTTGGQLFRLAPSAGSAPPAGRCGGPTAAWVSLAAARKRVRRGARVRITVTATPCPGAGGDVIELLRGKSGSSHAALDARCQAVFRPRVRHRTRFTAVLPQNGVHVAATSPSLKVKLKP